MLGHIPLPFSTETVDWGWMVRRWSTSSRPSAAVEATRLGDSSVEEKPRLGVSNAEEKPRDLLSIVRDSVDLDSIVLDSTALDSTDMNSVDSTLREEIAWESITLEEVILDSMEVEARDLDSMVEEEDSWLLLPDSWYWTLAEYSMAAFSWLRNHSSYSRRFCSSRCTERIRPVTQW